MATKKDIAKIKPTWDKKVPKCCCLQLGSPPFAGPNGCDFFSESSVRREPTIQSCSFPGLETKCQSMGNCPPAITHKMVEVIWNEK